jgi:hypothetical protein
VSVGHDSVDLVFFRNTIIVQSTSSSNFHMHTRVSIPLFDLREHVGLGRGYPSNP